MIYEKRKVKGTIWYIAGRRLKENSMKVLRFGEPLLGHVREGTTNNLRQNSKKKEEK